MTISTELVKELRQRTSAGVLACRQALEESGGDLEEAVVLLRERGLAAAEKKRDREALNGVLELYRHGEGRVGVMVEVNCETDFVARTDEFQHFAHEIALQVAAYSPRWIVPEEAPEEVLVEKREEAHRWAQREGKPQDVIPRIVEGRVEKFLDETCLLRQAYIRDDSKTVEELLKETIATVGENVVIRRFVRWEVGEALD